MIRQRLSWDAEKVAEIEKKADPYTMNQNHANNPVEKYKNWDTETGGEGVDTKTPWKGEGRLETGHPSPERQAVMAARKLEDKAIKCITIAQRMLPCASDSVIEEQATDLMYMPEKSILSTLQRQASLAEVLAGGKKDEDDEDASASKKADDAPVAPEEKKTKPEEKKEEAKEAAKPVMPEEKKEEEVKEAKKIVPEEKKEEEAKEAKKIVPEEKKEEEAKEAKKIVPEEKKEEEAKEAKKVEDDEDASASKKAGDMLDIIFDNAETKTGAKKLSGIVKQASTGDDSLNNLWDSPPDISKAFR